MPSHKIHLSIATEVNKKLNFDQDSIMLGSILPDITNELDHGISHFQTSFEYPNNLANADLFKEKYPNYKDGISIGYIIHLLTDRYYNEHFYKSNIKGIEYNKTFKHELFYQYDIYLLKHKKIIKFLSNDVINNMPKYENITFDNEYIKRYIKRTNETIDSTPQDNDYKVEFQDFLDELYYGCIEYINKEIKKYL